MLQDVTCTRTAAARIAHRRVQRRARGFRVVGCAMQDIVIVKYGLSSSKTFTKVKHVEKDILTLMNWVLTLQRNLDRAGHVERIFRRLE